MNAVLAVFLCANAMIVTAQRPFYAGLKPIGYPELADRFQPEEVSTQASTTAGLGNRFGEETSTVSTTTIRLPVDALGDKNLIDRISKWPVDKQPYWYINWKLIEAHRQQRPTIQEPSVGSQPAVGSQQPIAGQPQQQPGGFQQPSGSQQLGGLQQPAGSPQQGGSQQFGGSQPAAPQQGLGSRQSFNQQPQRPNFNQQYWSDGYNRQPYNQQQWGDNRRNDWGSVQFGQPQQRA